MIGCDKLYVHIQRVQASFCTRRILGVGDMTIRYDPPRRGRVIPMAVHLNEAQEYIEDGGS